MPFSNKFKSPFDIRLKMNPKNCLDPISLDKWIDIRIGEKGTPERDFFELNVQIKILKELLGSYNPKKLNRIVELTKETKKYLCNARKSLPADSYIKFEKELNSIENRLKKLR